MTTFRLRLLSLFLGTWMLTGELNAADVEQVAASIPWQQGPAVVALGEMAELQLPQDFFFTSGPGAGRMMEALGNQAHAALVGMVLFPDHDAFAVFSFEEIGLVSDSEKDLLNADALLEAIRQNTEQENVWRRQQGVRELSIVSWLNPPSYDDQMNCLQWSFLVNESDGIYTANFNLLFLGRNGVMTVQLVADPSVIDSVVPTLKGLMAGFQFLPGHRHGDWQSGDKLAGFGLKALITGGATVAAAKSGLLARFSKFLLIFLMSLGAGLTAFWKKLVGTSESPGPARGMPLGTAVRKLPQLIADMRKQS